MKKEKGSIAIFVLVALLFMVGFLILTFAGNINKSKTVKEQVDIINNIYQYSNQGLEDKRIANTKIKKGDFVEYDIAYTDASLNYQYTTTNGWRLLDYTDNGDGTYSNVKLISTGIPAKLYYDYAETTNSSNWFVNDEIKLTEFRTILGGSNYALSSNNTDYYALQAAAGLYYNFGSIKLAYGNSYRGKNLGHFTSITSNGVTYNSKNTVEKTGRDLFIANGVNAEVRLLTLPEVNKAIGRTDIDSRNTIAAKDDSIGLYRLDQLQNVTGMTDKTYNQITYYWLASPLPMASERTKVNYIISDGSITQSDSTVNGVRPLICLNGDIKLIDGDNNGALEIYFE